MVAKQLSWHSCNIKSRNGTLQISYFCKAGTPPLEDNVLGGRVNIQCQFRGSIDSAQEKWIVENKRVGKNRNRVLFDIETQRGYKRTTFLANLGFFYSAI